MKTLDGWLIYESTLSVEASVDNQSFIRLQYDIRSSTYKLLHVMEVCRNIFFFF